MTLEDIKRLIDRKKKATASPPVVPCRVQGTKLNPALSPKIASQSQDPPADPPLNETGGTGYIPSIPSDPGGLTEETLSSEIKSYDGLDGVVCNWDNPAEMFLAIVDDITPYQWQYEEMKRLGGYCDPTNRVKTPPTSAQPIKYLLAAANGSGKDQIILAAWAVWYACTAKRSWVKITSSSAEQIKTQTDPWVRWLIDKLNRHFGRVYGRSVRNYHAITEIGSRIGLHVTDDESKAEGAHPDPGGRLGIAINEAKSISRLIYQAMARCSGYDTWIEVSSPGKDSGRFYEKHLTADHYPLPMKLGKYFFRRITGFQCPHLTEAQRLEILDAGGGGETNALYESSWMANFSSIDEELVIHPYMLEKVKLLQPLNGKKRFGLDIGGGGDPTVMWLISGTKVVKKIKFAEKDIIIQTDRLYGYLSSNDFLDSYGFGDHNGLGQGVVDGLRHRGIKIVGLYAQESSTQPDVYANLGAELHFNIRDLIVNGVLPIPEDPDLRSQLTGRYYKEKGKGLKALESKRDYKKRNNNRSPDDSDAFVLAFADCTVPKLQAELAQPVQKLVVDLNMFLLPPSLYTTYMESRNNKPKRPLTAYDIA